MKLSGESPARPTSARCRARAQHDVLESAAMALARITSQPVCSRPIGLRLCGIWTTFCPRPNAPRPRRSRSSQTSDLQRELLERCRDDGQRRDGLVPIAESPATTCAGASEPCARRLIDGSRCANADGAGELADTTSHARRHVLVARLSDAQSAAFPASSARHGPRCVRPIIGVARYPRRAPRWPAPARRCPRGSDRTPPASAAPAPCPHVGRRETEVGGARSARRARPRPS